MKRRKVAVTGLTGVIGGILSKELSTKNQIIDLFHKTKHTNDPNVKKHIFLDLSKSKNISDSLLTATPDIVVHMAAITHIDLCETDKKNGKEGLVWKVNVGGTRAVAKFCAKNNIPLVFLSTECVFDGKEEYFSEDAKKNPINWYGATKSEAEDVIFASGAPFAVIRSVVAYHRKDESKTIYGKMLHELESKASIIAVNDQLFTPTYTYDIVKAIDRVIDENLRGVYHVAPSKSLSPYSFALLVAAKNKFSEKLVARTTLKKFYGAEKAVLRLKNSSLLSEKSGKILKFKAKLPEKAI